MKNILALILLLSGVLQAQNYVDLFKMGYGQTFNNEFEGTDNSTEVKTFDVDLTFPLVLNENHTLITGGLFSRNNLQLFPQGEFSSLYSTALKVGWAATWNEKWSTTLVALPKIASDYKDIDGDDFYIGGFGVLKYQKKENLIYRFGLYASSEAFGVFGTPIFGWYYLSPNSQFEMDVSLPISVDINYTEGVFTYGLDYYGIGRSFNIDENNADIYADLSSLEFASYLQFNAFDKSVLLRAKFGYASNDYEVYEQGEKIDLGIAAFSFGDDRTQLNPNIGGGLFLRFEAIYRFNLPVKEEDPEKK